MGVKLLLETLICQTQTLRVSEYPRKQNYRVNLAAAVRVHLSTFATQDKTLKQLRQVVYFFLFINRTHDKLLLCAWRCEC